MDSCSSELRVYGQVNVPGELNITPDSLSRIFSKVDGGPVPADPGRADTFRGTPDDLQFLTAYRRQCELSS